ncbi:alpha/beta hydrolase [Streptomyces mirabilis]
MSGLPKFLNQYEPLLDRYDLVSFDPRGVGATIPVRCGKTADDTGYDGADACAEHSGALLPYIATSHTARDLDLMRYLLGDERLHYFGVSYGTALGAVYAHLYPSHVGRLVLEASVEPTEDLDEEQVSQVQAAFDRFAAHCAARIRHCPTGDGPEEAARRMARLADRLEKTPASAGGGRTLDADDLAYAVSDYLDLGRDGWSPLAKALTALIDHNDGGPLSKGADDVGSADRAATPRDSSRAAQIAITCADSSLRPGFERLDRDKARIKAASPVFGAAWSTGVYLCYDWPFDGERATLQVNADGAAAVLVVGGTGDPTTPYPGARHMARAGTRRAHHFHPPAGVERCVTTRACQCRSSRLTHSPYSGVHEVTINFRQPRTSSRTNGRSAPNCGGVPGRKPRSRTPSSQRPWSSPRTVVQTDTRAFERRGCPLPRVPCVTGDRW